MKALFWPLFCTTGAAFLLIGTVLYPAITGWLLDLQGQTTWTAPSFWYLPLVLKVVRVIFIIVGAFLVAFGIGLIWLRRR